MLKKHCDIIQHNLAELVENTDISRIIPVLERKHVLSREVILRILSTSEDVKLQTTNLYTAIIKRGPQAFAKLRDALHESNHIDLAYLLTSADHQGMHCVSRSPSLNSVGSGESHNSGDSDTDKIPYADDGTQRLPFVVDDPKPLTRSCVSSNCNRNGESVVNGDNSFSVNSATGIKSDVSDKIPHSSSDFKSKAHKQTVVPFQLPSYYSELEPCISAGCISPYDDVNIRTVEVLPVKVIPATRWRHVAPLHYKMDSYPRGCALIVNNIDFEDVKSFPRRNGAENDLRRLKDLLEQFYFEVEYHVNETKMGMYNIVKKFSKKKELMNVDCVMVVFMSHGSEGASEEDTEIIGVDGIGFKTREIVRLFSNDSCQALINKPKVFFFQACRGILNDSGVLMNLESTSSNRTETDGRKIESRSAPVRIRTTSDVFIAYAVPPGRPANRDKFNGTWFIQTIVDVFSTYACKYDLEDMLKMVDNRIKNLDNLEVKNFQAVATTTIGWNKKLFFNPGLRLGKPDDEVSSHTVSSTNELDNEGMDVVDNSPEIIPTRGECQENGDCFRQGCFTKSKCVLH